jgi:uncharacterized protein
VLVSASAIGIYGDRSDELLTEQSACEKSGPNGPEFLAGLCTDWEAEAQRATLSGIRVVNARFGLVQTADGGALKKLLVPFRAGVGGPIGSGKQWQSWVALEDAIGAVHWALFDKTLSGAVNVVAPNAVTSAQYAKALGAVLGRPAFAAVPAFALKVLFGEMAQGALLPSQRVAPAALQRAGFEFAFPMLGEALAFTLGKRPSSPAGA